MTPATTVSTAIATLQERWGMAAPRRGQEAYGGVVGALATVPLPVDPATSQPDPAPGQPLPAPAIPVIPTGFAALDAVLGPGGVPRTASLALGGSSSAGRTTLALRLVAEAQAAGSIVAWLDLERSFDPVEAVARGVRLEWLVVLAPNDLDEALAMTGELLQGRMVDLLLLDLPAQQASVARLARAADRLARLSALARRAGTLLVLLEPPSSVGAPRVGARRNPIGTRRDPLGASVGLRLELAHRGWIRLGRDVVGRRTEVAVARNRFGPSGGRAELRILYAEGGPRDACLRVEHLLSHDRPTADGPPVVGPAPPDPPAAPAPSLTVSRPTRRPTIDRSDATPPSPLAPSPPSPRAGTGRGGSGLRVVPDGSARPGRPAVDRRGRGGRGPARTVARRPARDAARERPPARARGDVPRPEPGG
jgi:RecA/RadA recombinase